MCIKKYIVIVVVLFCCNNAIAGILINEIACAASGGDWVELFYSSSADESQDISGMCVTMYYGTNEQLAGEPVTMYSYDRPQTPWDDRFVVVHLTAPGTADETDSTGDTNSNGCIDVYCNNYSGSLWETDCVVSLDTDDEPSNNGIIDFMAYSNRDGSPNTTITGYMATAQGFGQWDTCSGLTDQECMFSIGADGLSSYMSISRRNTPDTNSPEDFSITKYMTPGRKNILSESVSGGKNLFKPDKRKISITPEDCASGSKKIELFVYDLCSIRLRIFSSIGILIYESPLYRDVNPGRFEIEWDIRGAGRKASTGLYIAFIEAVKKELKRTQEEKIYVILNKFKK